MDARRLIVLLVGLVSAPALAQAEKEAEREQRSAAILDEASSLIQSVNEEGLSRKLKPEFSIQAETLFLEQELQEHQRPVASAKAGSAQAPGAGENKEGSSPAVPGVRPPHAEAWFQPPEEVVSAIQQCVASDDCTLRKLQKESVPTFVALSLWCARNSDAPLRWKPGVAAVCDAMDGYRRERKQSTSAVTAAKRALRRADEAQLRTRQAYALALDTAAAAGLELAQAEVTQANQQLTAEAPGSDKARELETRRNYAQARADIARERSNQAAIEIQVLNAELKLASDAAKEEVAADLQRRASERLGRAAAELEQAERRVKTAPPDEQANAGRALEAAKASHALALGELETRNQERLMVRQQRATSQNTLKESLEQLNGIRERVKQLEAAYATRPPADAPSVQKASGPAGPTDSLDALRRRESKARAMLARSASLRDEAARIHDGSERALDAASLRGDAAEDHLDMADATDIRALGTTYSRPLLRCGGFGVMLPLVSTRRTGKGTYEVNGPVQAGLGAGYSFDMACGEEWTWGPQLFAYSEGLNPGQKFHLGLAGGASVTAFKYFSFGVAMGYDLFRSAQGQPTSGVFSGNLNHNLSWLFTFSVVSASGTSSSSESRVAPTGQ